jgi:hypothetical protein
MQYNIDSDQEFLRVTVSGRSEDRAPSELCAAILGECNKLGRVRVLIELDQKAPLSPGVQYELVNRLPEIGFTHRHRIALVHRMPAMQEANEFLNLLARNRGVNLRNFPSVANAEAWLRLEGTAA